MQLSVAQSSSRYSQADPRQDFFTDLLQIVSTNIKDLPPDLPDRELRIISIAEKQIAERAVMHLGYQTIEKCLSRRVVFKQDFIGPKVAEMVHIEKIVADQWRLFENRYALNTIFLSVNEDDVKFLNAYGKFIEYCVRERKVDLAKILNHARQHYLYKDIWHWQLAFAKETVKNQIMISDLYFEEEKITGNGIWKISTIDIREVDYLEELNLLLRRLLLIGGDPGTLVWIYNEIKRRCSSVADLRDLNKVLGMINDFHPDWKMITDPDTKRRDIVSLLFMVNANVQLYNRIVSFGKISFFPESGEQKSFYLQLKATVFLGRLQNRRREYDDSLLEIGRFFLMDRRSELYLWDQTRWMALMRMMNQLLEGGVLELVSRECYWKLVNRRGLLNLIRKEMLSEDWSIEKFRWEHEGALSVFGDFLNCVYWDDKDLVRLKEWKSLLEYIGVLDEFVEPFKGLGGVGFELEEMYFDFVLVQPEFWGDFVRIRREYADLRSYEALPLTLNRIFESSPNAKEMCRMFFNRQVESMSTVSVYDLTRMIDCREVLGIEDTDPAFRVILGRATEKDVPLSYRIYAENMIHALNVAVNSVEDKVDSIDLGEKRYWISYNFPEIRRYERSLNLMIPSCLNGKIWKDLAADLVGYLDGNVDLQGRVFEFTAVESRTGHPLRWETIKANLLNETVANWFVIQGQPTLFQGKLYSCLGYILSLSAEPREGELSERQLAVLRFGAMVAECVIGKEWGVDLFYEGIPQKFKILENSGSTTSDKARGFLFDLLQRFYLEKMESENFIDLIGDQWYKTEPLHGALQIKNVLAPTIGLRHKIRFDPHVAVVSDHLLKGTSMIEKTFLLLNSPRSFFDWFFAEFNRVFQSREVPYLFQWMEELIPGSNVDETFWEYNDETDGVSLSLSGALRILGGAGGAGGVGILAVKEEGKGKRVKSEGGGSPKRQMVAKL